MIPIAISLSTIGSLAPKGKGGRRLCGPGNFKTIITKWNTLLNGIEVSFSNVPLDDETSTTMSNDYMFTINQDSVVMEANILANNGIVHVIDCLLVSPANLEQEPKSVKSGRRSPRSSSPSSSSGKGRYRCRLQ